SQDAPTWKPPGKTRMSGPSQPTEPVARSLLPSTTGKVLPSGQPTAHGQRVLPRSTSNAAYARGHLLFTRGGAPNRRCAFCVLGSRYVRCVSGVRGFASRSCAWRITRLKLLSEFGTSL